ncbi:MAG TPA: hypothetical protein DEA44_10780 [Firmicutes bacterium]|nr:hypothetical protein [Bacillota bacterium]
MRKIIMLCLTLALTAGLIAGCGGGGKGMQRLTGLSPEQVVATFQDLAKHQKYTEAALYVSPVSLASLSVSNFLKDDLGLSNVASSNLLSVRQLGQSGDFAVVLATLQDGVNTSNISVKVIGLERIKGEWYIVDNDTIAREAKYRLLQDLINNVL